MDDTAGEGAVAGRHGGTGVAQQDLLGAQGEGAGLAEQSFGGLAAQDIGGADEAGDELGGGVLVHVGRRADLLDAALAEHREAIAHRQRFFLVVGDVGEGDADLALELLQLDLQFLAQLEIQRAQRLVEQQQLAGD